MSGARARVETELTVDNARLRADYLRETPLLTAAGIRAASGLGPRNRSEPASRWKREGRLFAVRRSGIDLYPAFQFADGSPLPPVKAILAALPAGMTGWQTALWFASSNGWLGGAAPQERLSDPEAVVAAAGRPCGPAVGQGAAPCAAAHGGAAAEGEGVRRPRAYRGGARSGTATKPGRAAAAAP
ncbi:MAG: hypothetical protein OXC28_13555, partial [Defluviicoccus sp.]|nr:hypothetical protein [Defluviicoccus sp.]